MAEKRRPELGTVQETLLIPLYARAVETRRQRELLHDPRAVEMVEAIDYDFTRFDGAKSLIGANLRTLLLDTWVRRFLAEHPHGTVVEIGTGLNTRFERVDNGTVRWFDVDLPDVIALRRTFFDDTERRRMIAGSVTDPDWVTSVADSPGPYFVVAEAVLIYLEEAAVQDVFRMIGEKLPGSLLALETAAGAMIDAQDRHDVLSKVDARMHWRCDDPSTPERWDTGARLVETTTLNTLPHPVRDRLPWSYRVLLSTMGTLRRRQIEAYRFNLYRMEAR
ncbi:class I SAM-dependent methyltransferase [Streptomyces lasiicapitis]|uniref:Tetracenomycin C synthesis protein n=1 Tax=Streptomyces lasiicapitis TaxID=1923961 RepID=A0ABQ2LKU4_9ACTN|nr:class I SAM-dependent methyltransferase [Streptomyces lasiicapitis]GGO38217.1 tetracenomycin C synthesis protein [Streptomyces lasiicapitis]